MGKAKSPQARPPERLAKTVVLLQLALVLMRGESLNYARLTDEFRLSRRTAERYMAALRDLGLPVEQKRVGREAEFALAVGRARDIKIEAIDVPPAAARSLSLLLVAAALLPSHLGVREAVDATVRAALRVRGLKAASALRRIEDAVLVLENDAKDYAGFEPIYGALIDAALAGSALAVRYRSPQKPAPTEEKFYVATVGLYRGGLYALAVPLGDDGSGAIWRALERIEALIESPSVPPLETGVRLRALDEARRRWGPARPGPRETRVTLHFSDRVAPYLLARTWHPHVEVEPWPANEGGGVRMAIRLAGDTTLFEAWVQTWGDEVKILRPVAMADRLASIFERAAAGHRAAAAAFADDTNAENA